MPSYSLKRTYQAGYYPSSKRTRRTLSKPKLVRSLALSKPEVKDIVLTRSIAQLNNNSIVSAGIFNSITQGVLNSNRIGDRIRVLSIEVSGRPMGTDNSLTFCLICPNRADRVPVLSDFGAHIGTLYDASNGWELMHFIRDPTSLEIIQKATYKFPLGMVVHYDQPSEEEPNGVCSKNEVYATHVNKTGANVENIAYNIRIRFVDA